jgi:uncharacterized protein
MKFTQENADGLHRVRGYDEAQVTVEWGELDGQGEPQLISRELVSSFVVFPDGVLDGELPTSVSALEEEHLLPLLERQTEVLLLGTMAGGQFPPPELIAWLSQRGIGLEVMNTPAACRTYNLLMFEERRVAAMILFGDG